MGERIPVTVLTGYLGAGKTTLLNRILSEAHGHRIAVIVNEFGEVGIDGALIVGTDEELFEMNNGCVCCTVRGDLLRTLHALVARKGSSGTAARPFDAIVVETTGLADPGPVAQTFFVDPLLQQKLVLDGIVTVVDARHILLRLADSREAQEQVAFADQIVLNKTDLVDAATLDRIEARLRAINVLAPIHRARRAEVELDAVIGRGGFDLERIVTLDPGFLTGNAPAHGETGHVHDAHCGHPPVAADAPGGATRDDQRHDPTIRSVSLTTAVPMDAERVSEWLTALTRSRGPDILRAKGIIAIAAEPRRMVVQAVHMLLEGDFQRAWRPDEARLSRLVFIGRRLDAGALQAGFDACAADPAEAQPSPGRGDSADSVRRARM
ncbi:MAG: GTP-binding protein [Casimicrobiaceae bacterium]